MRTMKRAERKENGRPVFNKLPQNEGPMTSRKLCFQKPVTMMRVNGGEKVEVNTGTGPVVEMFRKAGADVKENGDFMEMTVDLTHPVQKAAYDKYSKGPGGLKILEGVSPDDRLLDEFHKAGCLVMIDFKTQKVVVAVDTRNSSENSVLEKYVNRPPLPDEGCFPGG